MSHIHIPDGVLPVWLWVAGWVLAVAALGIASRAAGEAALRKVPLMAVLAALMLVAMSSEIVPIAYHMNLSVVAGALLGPAMSLIVAFIVVAALAMLGHGGVTVVGLNTIMISAEMVLGWLLVRFAVRLLGRARLALASGIATLVVLAMTTTMLIGVVALAGRGAAEAREIGALDPSTLRFENPLAGGVFRLGPGRELGHEEGGGTAGRAVPPVRFSVARFAAVAYALGAIGWVIEALVTAAVIGFLGTVRPRLIFDGALDHPRTSMPGDEHFGH